MLDLAREIVCVQIRSQLPQIAGFGSRVPLPSASREGRVGALLRPGERGMQRAIRVAILLAIGLGWAGCRSEEKAAVPAPSATPAAADQAAPTPPPAAAKPTEVGAAAQSPAVPDPPLIEAARAGDTEAVTKLAK